MKKVAALLSAIALLYGHSHVGATARCRYQPRQAAKGAVALTCWAYAYELKLNP